MDSINMSADGTNQAQPITKERVSIWDMDPRISFRPSSSQSWRQSTVTTPSLKRSRDRSFSRWSSPFDAYNRSSRPNSGTATDMGPSRSEEILAPPHARRRLFNWSSSAPQLHARFFDSPASYIHGNAAEHNDTFESVPITESATPSRVSRFWSLLTLEVRQAYHGTASDTAFNTSWGNPNGSECPRALSNPNYYKKFREMHAITGVGCPPLVVKHAIRMHRNQLEERDENGDLPIHLSAKNPTLPAVYTQYPLVAVAVNLITCASLSADNNSTSDALPGNQSLSSDLCVTDLLVKAYPPSALCPDRERRFPLNIALEAGKTWEKGGVKSLVSAAPQVLRWRDCKSKLYPFMIAAVATRAAPERSSNDMYFSSSCDKEIESTELDGLETIYQLLHAFPELVQGAMST